MNSIEKMKLFRDFLFKFYDIFQKKMAPHKAWSYEYDIQLVGKHEKRAKSQS